MDDGLDARYIAFLSVGFNPQKIPSE